MHSCWYSCDLSCLYPWRSEKVVMFACNHNMLSTRNVLVLDMLVAISFGHVDQIKLERVHCLQDGGRAARQEAERADEGAHG